MHKLTAILAITLAAVGVTAVAQPAAAETEDDLHPDVVRALEAVPGGVVIDEWHAYWPALGMELSVPADGVAGRAAVGRCASGRICAFSASAGQGSMLSWTTCNNHSTSVLPTVRSIANARSSGVLAARSGATIRATATAGVLANVTGSVDNLRCQP